MPACPRCKTTRDAAAMQNVKRAGHCAKGGAFYNCIHAADGAAGWSDEEVEKFLNSPPTQDTYHPADGVYVDEHDNTYVYLYDNEIGVDGVPYEDAPPVSRSEFKTRN